MDELPSGSAEEVTHRHVSSGTWQLRNAMLLVASLIANATILLYSSGAKIAYDLLGVKVAISLAGLSLVAGLLGGSYHVYLDGRRAETAPLMAKIWPVIEAHDAAGEPVKIPPELAREFSVLGRLATEVTSSSKAVKVGLWLQGIAAAAAASAMVQMVLYV